MTVKLQFGRLRYQRFGDKDPQRKLKSFTKISGLALTISGGSAGNPRAIDDAVQQVFTAKWASLLYSGLGDDDRVPIHFVTAPAVLPQS